MQDLGIISPSLDEFRALAAQRRVIPVRLKVLADALTPIGIYRSLALQDDGTAAPGTFLLESAKVTAEGESAAWDRYSFIGASSRSTLTTVDGKVHWQGETPAGAPTEGDPVEAIAKTLHMLHTEPLPGLPPLTSGLVGYLGWDVVRRWEHLPFPPADDVHLPEFALNMVSDMAIHDNTDGTVLLVANAINFNGTDENVDAAYTDARARLNRMVECFRTFRGWMSVSVMRSPKPGLNRGTWTPLTRRRKTLLTAMSSRSYPHAGSRSPPKLTPWTCTGCCASQTRPRTCTCLILWIRQELRSIL